VYASGTADFDSVAAATQCGPVVTNTNSAGPFIVPCSASAQAHFVTIRQENPASGFLSITEVEVRGEQTILPPAPPALPPPLPFPPAPPPYLEFNITDAIGLNDQDSGDLAISNIYDGNPSTLAYTEGATPWISVQLASPSDVTSVAVYNRADSYAYLLGSFTVWVSDAYASGPTGVTSSTATQCGGVQTSTATLGPFTVPCSTKGSYVTVRQEAPGSGFLTIGEIQVRGAA